MYFITTYQYGTILVPQTHEWDSENSVNKNIMQLSKETLMKDQKLLTQLTHNQGMMRKTELVISLSNYNHLMNEWIAITNQQAEMINST